MEGYFRVCMER